MRANSGPIKVLHVINDLSLGGAEIMLCRLLSTMDHERFDSVVISLKNSGDLRRTIAATGIPVYSLKIAGPAPGPSSLWRLIRLMNRTKPDIIQGWLPQGNLVALAAGTLASRRVPVIWNIRQSLESLEYEKLTTRGAIKLGGRLSHRPAMIIYNSKTGATQHAKFGYSLDKATVIYNGFDTTIFTPSIGAREGLRSELGVDSNTILVGLISRYHVVKNQANFLRAAAQLRKRYSNVRFVMCGSGIDWDNQPLKRLIQDLELTSAIHLLGPRHDVPRIIAALDIAASASYGEGFPNAIGEAMACAVPCVATDVSDVSWIINNAGIVVPKNDSASMAQAFARMLNLGGSARRALGLNGRARVMKHFQLTSVAEQYANLYETVLAHKAHETTATPLNSCADGYSDGASSDTINAAI